MASVLIYSPTFAQKRLCICSLLTPHWSPGHLEGCSDGMHVLSATQLTDEQLLPNTSELLHHKGQGVFETVLTCSSAFGLALRQSWIRKTTPVSRKLADF